MKVIYATSWNGTTFCYNWNEHKFIQWEDADFSANDHFDADMADIETAKELAESDGLKNVRVESVEL